MSLHRRRLARVSMNSFCCLQRNFSTGAAPLLPIQLPSRLETHLWYAVPDEVKSAALLNQYSEILSPLEREYISGVRGDHLKKTALLARVLVRTTISRYQINGKINPKCLKFRKNIHGKPELEWDNDNSWSPPPIHFNISHTSSLIACGVTLNAPIGVDIEEKQRKLKNNILSFARRYFSALEVETLSLISDPELQRHQFIKLWTLKEAYVKALGKGFSAMPFSTFTIKSRNPERGTLYKSADSDTEDKITVESCDDPKNNKNEWHFRLLELAGTHYAAICVGNDETAKGSDSTPTKLTVRKTVPLVGDELVSGTDAVIIGGLTE